MTATHTDENGKVRTVKLETKRGKLFVDNSGMVKVVGGKFKGLTKISYDVLENEFKLGSE